MYTHIMAKPHKPLKRVYTHIMETTMSRHYFIIESTERVYTHLDEPTDEPFVFEATMDTNPLDMDDPEYAYREYLAERFAR